MAREKSGLSTQEVAEKLYMTEAKIIALENDQYEKLPSPTFVQGYLRKYAALLNLDGDKLLKCYGNYLQSLQDTVEQVIAPQTQMDHMVVGKKPPKWILPASLFAVAVLVLVTVIIFSGNKGEPEPSNTPIHAQQVELPPLPDAPEGILDETAASQQELVEMFDSSSITEGQDGAAESAVLENGIDQPAPPATQDQLVFGFSDDCWLQVSDASGEVIHAALHGIGEPVVINGVGPFTILLGNANAASVALNGETVEIEIKPGHRTARFSVQ